MKRVWGAARVGGRGDGREFCGHLNGFVILGFVRSAFSGAVTLKYTPSSSVLGEQILGKA